MVAVEKHIHTDTQFCQYYLFFIYLCRSFQYVSDLVQGLVALMNSNYSDPVNIGNPEEVGLSSE